MGLFQKKTAQRELLPLTSLEYRTGDGRHWGFHYRLFRERESTVLNFSRVMPEQLQRIAVPETVWEKVTDILKKYDVIAWDGFDRCRLNHGRTKRWLLYLTFVDGSDLRAEGCGAYPKNHEAAEDELLLLLNSLIDPEI